MLPRNGARASYRSRIGKGQPLFGRTSCLPTGDAPMSQERTMPRFLADVRIWLEIEAALSPIIGSRGVTALFKRSVYLLRGDYAWLAAAFSVGGLMEWPALLQAALSAQPLELASKASGALLRTFYDLLSRLIGASLCERLLFSILDHHACGDTAKDAL